MVRQSDSRSKADFDNLAEDIEKAWYGAVSGEFIRKDSDQERMKSGLEDAATTTDGKKLMVVVLYAMVDIRENGYALPTVSE